MPEQLLHVHPCTVEVDHDKLEAMLKDYVLDTAILMHGRSLQAEYVLEIVVTDHNRDATLVEIAGAVLACGEVRRVALRTSKLWPTDEDPERVVSSRYFVCDRTPDGWTTRQQTYYYPGDDRRIDWFDLPVQA